MNSKFVIFLKYFLIHALLRKRVIGVGFFGGNNIYEDGLYGKNIFGGKGGYGNLFGGMVGDLVERELSELSGFWEEKVYMEAIFLVAKVDTFVISEDIKFDRVGYLGDMVDSEVVIVDTVVAIVDTNWDMEDTEVVMVDTDWNIVDKVALGPDRMICIEDTVD